VDTASIPRSTIKPIPLHKPTAATRRAWRVRDAARFGFTLLELLVAMLVMGLIVLASAMMYQSGANAYHIGMQRAEVTLVGRSLVQMIAAELSHAVADDPPAGVPDQVFEFRLLAGDRIEFAKFAPSDTEELNAMRGIMRVAYQKSGGAVGTVQRRVRYYSSEDYGLEEDSGWIDLADRILNLEFRPDGNWTNTATTNLPLHVDVFVDTLTEEDALRNDTQNARTYHRRVYMANRNRYR
jgi:prepilin-type N-terminal cleavage/methylation domain-containing protein